jgi:ribosome-binding factor A
MPSHRSLRIAEAIREVVSSAILFEVADPRIRGVTILKVEVSGDLRNATAYVSIMGTESEQRSAMSGLRSATGFLQARVANRLQTRSTPVLVFKLDDSVKKSVQMSRLIDDALANDAVAHEADESDDDELDEEIDDSEKEIEDDDEPPLRHG